MSTNPLELHHPSLPLGKEVGYPTHYDPDLLHPIRRSLGRASLPVLLEPVAGQLASDLPGANLPFTGWDMWRGYELSWLDSQGLPKVGILKAWVPCTSVCIIESKSFKLYLNGLNNTRYPDTETIRTRIQADLSERAGAQVRVEILLPESFAQERIIEPPEGCLDNQTIEIDRYQPDASLLACVPERVVSESLFSRLLKSNCPVTGQPDWASLHIDYKGPAIDHAGLLRYIVSYREHEGFHEQCVEQIFCDLMLRCHPERLSVYARYTRRGGMDINPWRATPGCPEPSANRSAQQ